MNAGTSLRFLVFPAVGCRWNCCAHDVFAGFIPLEERKMAMQRQELDKRETGNLIGSDKVEGTAVYGADDSKIGSIERVMIDKLSGRISYAVLGFGGFLGLGNDHYPLPWQSL